MFLDATLGTDGYKVNHAPMYPQGTTEVYSNFTPRSVKHFKGLADYDGKIVVLGIQGAISEIVQLWNLSFFDESQEVAVGFYKNEMDQYLGPDAVSVESLRSLHKLGYLPLEFRAIEEGSRIPAGIPMLTVRSTVPEFYWLVNYLETILSNLLWKPSTCATVAYEYKRLAEKYAKLTGVDDFTVSIQCHDFSGRGAHGLEDAARSGMGHLASFIGSDTLFSTSYARKYYNEKGLVSISVPATEHAVTSSNILEIEQRLQEGERPRDLTLLGIIEEMEANNEDIRLIAEVCFIYRLITEIVPTGIVSNVCDTYSFWDVVTRGMKYLKNVILNRPDNALGLAKVVVRPDSGDPVEVICGLGAVEEIDSLGNWDIRDAIEGNGADVVKYDGKYYTAEEDDVEYGYDGYRYVNSYKLTEVSEAEVKGAIQVLWETFGGTVTETGHKLLDRHIGLIYGDSITLQRAEEIFKRLEAKGFSSGNVVFGVGSYTYHYMTRDTLGFAMKATHVVVNDREIPIFKEPKTDSKKKSAKGYLCVVKNEENAIDYTLLNDVTFEEQGSEDNELKQLWINGSWKRRTTLTEIRQRLANN